MGRVLDLARYIRDSREVKATAPEMVALRTEMAFEEFDGVGGLRKVGQYALYKGSELIVRAEPQPDGQVILITVPRQAPVRTAVKGPQQFERALAEVMAEYV